MNNQIQLVLKSSTTELSLNDRELGIYLTPELEGLTGLPEIRTTSGVNAGYDGGWTSAQNYDARSITIRGVIANEDVATVEQLRRQLTTLAGQGKNEELTLDLVTQAGKAYTIQVRTIALEMSLQKVLTQQEFMLQLRADDPLVYDASETTHEALLRVAQATGGFTIDFELPLAITGSSEETIVNNEGLEQVPTVTRMYGELHNPKIINQTTNQFMQIEADLGFAEGEWTTPSEPVEGKNLTINGAPENAPLSDFKLKGNTEQDGTPTPDAPVAVQTVTGENVVKITDGQGAEQSYEVNLGKNLLNIEDGSLSSSGVAVTIADGLVSASGTVTSTWGFNFTQADRPFAQKLEPGTYTFSINKALNVRFTLVLRKAATSVQSVQIQAGSLSVTFTISQQIEAYSLWSNASQGTEVDISGLSVQIEKGSQDTSYAAYFEPIELCKIGDYQDSIYKSDGKWYVRKEVGKIIEDGSQAWYRLSTAISGKYMFDTDIAGMLPATSQAAAPPVFCSHFTPKSFNDLHDNGTIGISGRQTGRDGVYIYDDVHSVANDFKNWLVSNPMTIYYPLATPTDTEITNEALVAQLEALAAATMYNPQTNITTLYAEGNEQPTLDVSYFTDKNPDTRDELVIDSRLRTITLNGLDVYHLQAPGSEFLMLAPGENRLALQSDITGDNGYAQVSYKQGYLSI